MVVDEIDLGSLVLARNDGHPDGDWWFDPRNGVSLYYGVDDDTDLPELVQGVHVVIPHDPQPRDDIDWFFSVADQLGVDEELVVRLWGAFRGKGGMKRFREVVGRTPAGPLWADLTMRRESARAIDWLLERDLVESGSAAEHRAELLAGLPAVDDG